jgi:hypothetical protein
MYDAPPPKPKPKAQTNSMLDMYDAPKAKPTAEIEVVDTSISGNFFCQQVDSFFRLYVCVCFIKSESIMCLSDVERTSVAAFNSNNFNNEQVAHDKISGHKHQQEEEPLVLSAACRFSVLARCLDELQLSLGCVPTMSHPLATSGQTRALLKVR